MSDYPASQTLGRDGEKREVLSSEIRYSKPREPLGTKRIKWMEPWVSVGKKTGGQFQRKSRSKGNIRRRALGAVERGGVRRKQNNLQ